MLIAAELHDLPEGSESGDSETATEVDVSYSFLPKLGTNLEACLETVKNLLKSEHLQICPECPLVD